MRLRRRTAERKLQYCPYCPGLVEYTNEHVQQHMDEAVAEGELVRNEDGSYSLPEEA